MKNFLFVPVTFIVSFLAIKWIGDLISPSDASSSASSLQSAVTFGGVNYLNIFIYIIIAMIATAVIFFTAKSRRSQNN